MSKVKKKIGLVTWLGGPNYGTVLQSYALYRKISELGYDVKIIRKYDFIWGVKLSLNHFLSRFGINILRTRDPKTLKMQRIRAFQASTFKCSRIVGKLGIHHVKKSFDIFVCGSDQMWNTWNCFDPFFFLDFAADKKRVAYAQSIGTDSIKPGYEAPVRELLAGFDAISVREKSAQKVLTQVTKRDDITLCADPALLLSMEEWLDFAIGADKTLIPEDEFILCYLLRARSDYDSILFELKKEYCINRVVIVPSGENPDLKIEGACTPDGVGASEFVALFSRASIILTDSFHGSIFSLVFKKHFINLRRFDDSTAESQNSRLYDMAESLGFGNRFYDPENSDWKNPIDYNTVSARMNELINHSMKYLKDNIL